MEFRQGDIVEWAGVRGEVVATSCGDAKFTTVTFRERDEVFLDGKRHDGNKVQLLKLIERPKKKVVFEAWANLYAQGLQQAPGMWRTKVEADRAAGSDRIACVQVTGEYEVEE